MNTPTPYEAPTVLAYGTISSLTAAGDCPGELDDEFDEGTPFGDVTCS